MNDLVHILDKKYSGANAVACPNEGQPARLQQSGVTTREHGKMGVHGSGGFLVCGICDAKKPVGLPDPE